MNGLAKSGLAATAAVALSGAGAVALSGSGVQGSAPTGRDIWDANAMLVVAKVDTLVAPVRDGRRATVWNRGSGLASVESTPDCARRRGRQFSVSLPLADPGQLRRPVSVTLRLHMVPRGGWVQGEAVAGLAGGETRTAFIEVGGGQQYLTIFAPAAEVRARGELLIKGVLLACSRGGSAGGSLRLDAIDVSS